MAAHVDCLQVYRHWGAREILMHSCAHLHQFRLIGHASLTRATPNTGCLFTSSSAVFAYFVFALCFSNIFALLLLPGFCLC